MQNQDSLPSVDSTKPKATIHDILKRPASFIEWLYAGYLSRNEGNLLKQLATLDTDVTLEDLEYHGLIKRIAHNASQIHYQRCVFN